MNANSNQAYKKGYQDFYGRDFLVTKDVLIPRPETEMIIDTVLNLAGKPFLPGVKPAQRKLPQNPTILDVGTGSGCIAITIKKELSEAKVIGVDIDSSALEIAEKNAKKFGTDVDFCISDLLKNVDFAPDVIVANLPYVDPEWDWLDKKALSIEPEIALYAEDHGLALIKKLIDQAESEYLILESDPSQHQQIKKYAEKKYTLLETRGYIQVFKLT